MAIIEEVEPHTGDERRIGLRRRLRIGITRVVQLQVKLDKDDSHLPQYYSYLLMQNWSEKEYHRLNRTSKKFIEKNRASESDPKKKRRAVEKFNAMYEEMAKRDFLYSHQNQSYASGIGEFASNCVTFVGNSVLGILEKGLLLTKSESVYQLLSIAEHRGISVVDSVLENPKADIVSAINDLLLMLQVCHDSCSKNDARVQRSGHSIAHRNYESIFLFSYLIYCRTQSTIFHAKEPLHINSTLLKQIFAIRRFLPLFEGRRPSIHYDNIIAILLLTSHTDAIGMQIATYTHMLHDSLKVILDLNIRYHHTAREDPFFTYMYWNPEVFFSNVQKSESFLNYLWRSTLRLSIAIQLFRIHIEMLNLEEVDYSDYLKFGIMSYICKDLEVVHPAYGDIRSGIQNMAQKLLSAENKYMESDYGFQVELFTDILQTKSLLDVLNSNSKAWDGVVSRWLTKNPSHSQSRAVLSEQKYWMALNGFRQLSLIEKFSQRCQTIFNNTLVFKRFAQWLDLSCVETCRLTWVDLDPDNNWKTGFWHIQTPPKGVEIKLIEYCMHHRRWRIVKEKCRFEHRKLYGSMSRRKNNSSSYRWYAKSELETDIQCECWSFHPISDWRVYLQWEEREIHIKNMIVENLRRTRPDIMNDDSNIVLEICRNASEANLDVVNDEVIHTQEESQSPGCAPDSSSDVYPSYDDVYIYQ